MLKIFTDHPIIVFLLIALFLLGIALVFYSFFMRKNTLFMDTQKEITQLIEAQKAMEARLSNFYNLMHNNMRNDLHSLNETLNQKLQAQSLSTQASLGDLKTKLTLIDRAQETIQKLSSEVINLQNIFSNKQARGAFAEKQMEAIIADALPPKSYQFQPSLSNQTRPDCLIYMPNGAPPLAIDAKFPLEAWIRYKNSQTSSDLKFAKTEFKRNIEQHIQTIAQKYLIFGETQDVAFLFVPSEAIFATIHDEFEEIIQKAHHARIMIISPSLLLLSISIVKSIFKDAHMREQASQIQKEVHSLLIDIQRLEDRVKNLINYHEKIGDTIKNIGISSNKISERCKKITSVELEPQPDQNLELS